MRAYKITIIDLYIRRKKTVLALDTPKLREKL